MGVHDGHRRRMRERFRREGLDGFADHEVLELVLFDCIPNGNVNPLAHELLDTFGSLHGVLEARMDQLLAVKGVGERTAAHLATLLPIFRRYQQSVCADRKKIQNRSQASAYCLALLSGWRTERFYLLSLNGDMELMGTRLIAEGSLTEVSAYPRLVVEAALNHNAHSVVFCHNHPGGSLRPSADDIQTTLLLRSILEPMGIAVLDHIIVADGQVYSMMQQGDLNPEALLTHLPTSARTLVAADSSGKLLPRRKKRMNPTSEE